MYNILIHTTERSSHSRWIDIQAENKAKQTNKQVIDIER
jgi:phage anti-repressor protein